MADANTDQSQPVSVVPRTTFTVNADKRVTAVKDPAGNSRSKSYTPFQDVATATNAEGGVTTNTYGANGGQSLTRSASPTGSAVQIAYANPATTGNPTANFQPSSSTDRQGNTTLYTYNGAGNLASTKRPPGGREGHLQHAVLSPPPPIGQRRNATRYPTRATKQLTTITHDRQQSRRAPLPTHVGDCAASGGAGRTTTTATTTRPGHPIAY